jgi:ABC-2 type transport system ATP-binding protein
MVQTTQLCKSFGSFAALNNVTLEVGRGQVFGLLGPNGAGKSTLIRTLMGFLKPSSGSATVDGMDCYSDRLNVHQQVTYLPGDARVFGLMKGRSVLKQFVRYRSNASYQRALEIAERLELDLSRWVGLMSTGMRQKLALAVCLSVDCPLVILDEPTANLDPTIRGRILDFVSEAKRAGTTVIFSSHVLSEIEEVCDEVGILKKGQLVFRESMSSLNRQHRVTVSCDAGLPPVPAPLADVLTILSKNERSIIETPDRVPEVLRWLAQADLDEVSIEPMGLKSVYQRFHQ